MGSTKTIHVDDATQLKLAIATYSGDTIIVLAAGDYGTVSIANKASSGSLTLKAADISKPPVMTLAVTKSTDIHLSGIGFKASGTKWDSALSVTSSSNISVENSSFRGIDLTYSDQARGMLVNNSDHVTVSGNNFEGLYRGAVFTNSHDLSVIGNSVANNRSEGFNFASVQNVEISKNSATDFRPEAGDHPDFIQFWTRGTSVASENIHIYDNTLVQGVGGGAQGIFMDNDDHIPYKNVVIENNVINSSFPRGISVTEASGLVIKNNKALSVDDSVLKLSISVDGSTDVDVSGNLSNALSILTSTNVKTAGNVTSGGLEVIGGKTAIVSASIVGGSGADTLKASNGGSILDGAGGNDTLSGGRGDDVLQGGAGSDVMTGGLGADQFKFSGAEASKLFLSNGKQDFSRHDVDKIYDLSFSEGDTIVFSNFAKGTFAGKSGDMTIDSIDDFVDLSHTSSFVHFSEKGGMGKTGLLIMQIEDAQHQVIEELHLSSVAKAFWDQGGLSL